MAIRACANDPGFGNSFSEVLNVSDSIRVSDPLLDAPCLSPAEHNFRVNWSANVTRTRHHEPVLCPEFVVHQGRGVRLVDVRGADELLGPQGYVPGIDWVPLEHAFSVLSTLPTDAPLVLVSRDGDEAAALARELEQRGFQMVAAMREGMLGWRHLGFSISRKPEILRRKNELRRIEPDPDDGSRLTLMEIEEHVGNPFEVRWVRMAGLLLQGRHHCVDGRDDSGVVGTPGGDAGEFLTLLASMEHALGRELTHVEVGGLFHHTLDAFGAFYMHTDVESADKLIHALRSDPRLEVALRDVHDAMAWRAFFASPPSEVRPFVLEHLLVPDHHGCGHLKMMWKYPETYGVRPGLVSSYVQHFFESRWQGADECEHVVLAGTHDEKGVLVVRIEGDIFPFSQIPLVSPMCHNSQMFVSHPQVASYYRGQLAEFLCRQRDVLVMDVALAETVRRYGDALAERQTGATLARLAAGLPIFEVTFRADGGVDVRYGGEVPSAG